MPETLTPLFYVTGRYVRVTARWDDDSIVEFNGRVERAPDDDGYAQVYVYGFEWSVRIHTSDLAPNHPQDRERFGLVPIHDR